MRLSLIHISLVGAVTLPVLVVGAVAVVDWVSALVIVLTLPLLPLFAALIGRATQDSTCLLYTSRCV